ncbi:MAG: 7-carboxy-7-deazaguanine synthase QueE [Neisseriaceae bacterium]
MKWHTEYRIVELFESLQGEGYNTGMPAVFIRLGKCNLACRWCDTPYNRFKMLSLEQIIDQVTSFQSKNIIITGGEPTIQPDLPLLLQELKKLNYFLAIETNGIKPVPTEIDYIAVSPKRVYEKIYQTKGIKYADEVRIVVDGDISHFCHLIEKKIKASNYYLSPCEEGEVMNLGYTIKQLSLLNQRKNALTHWQLSLQTHKLAGIR